VNVYNVKGATHGLDPYLSLELLRNCLTLGSALINPGSHNAAVHHHRELANSSHSPSALCHANNPTSATQRRSAITASTLPASTSRLEGREVASNHMAFCPPTGTQLDGNADSQKRNCAALMVPSSLK
jgi:hypothetical protein